MDDSSTIYNDGVAADFTVEEIAVRRTWPRRHPGSICIVDPATGALEIAPDSYEKVDKAIRRSARSIYLRLLLRNLFFKFQLFTLKARYSILCLRGKFMGIPPHFIIGGVQKIRSWVGWHRPR